MKPFPPVIKWFGSKRPIAKTLAEHFRQCETYYEPFIGGGAMLPFAKSKFGFASDIIPELINLWNLIKSDPKFVADEYRKRWHRLQIEGSPVYYEVRDSFNKTRNPLDFLFITRTCVNGMIRYNSDGDFNNSFHLSRPGINPDTLEQILFQWSKAIQSTTFLNVDYRECLASVKEGDFVFLDPPYGGTKDRYTHSEFCLNDLYSELDRLNSIGAYWMLTFDGSSGERVYNYAPPQDLFKHKFSVYTGNSAFSRLIDKKKNAISESVYLNFEPANIFSSLFYENFNDVAFPVSQQM